MNLKIDQEALEVAHAHPGIDQEAEAEVEVDLAQEAGQGVSHGASQGASLEASQNRRASPEVALDLNLVQGLLQRVQTDQVQETIVEIQDLEADQQVEKLTLL